MKYSSVGVCQNVFALALVMLLTACASVPEVESRLRDLSFSPYQHVVRAGDTFESVAWRYRLEPQQLAALNPTLQGALQPGMRINVREGAPVRDDERRYVAEAPRYEQPARQPGQQAVIVSPAPSRPSAPQPTYLPEQRYADTNALGRRDAQSNQRAAAEVRPRWRPEPLVPVEPYRDEYAQGRVEQSASLQQDPWRNESRPTWQQPAAESGPAERRQLDPRRSESGFADQGRQPELLARAEQDVWRREESWPQEEIIPDDLDPLPAPTRASTDARAAMDVQLARYEGRWSWPTDGAIARGFAPERAGGQGVDIAGVPGQDVRAALDGTVVYSGRDLSGGGNLVIVRHDDQLMTTYSHADALFVAEDDVVRAGDPIASLGWNAARESVLRFEVRRDGSPLNPMDFLPGR